MIPDKHLQSDLSTLVRLCFQTLGNFHTGTAIEGNRFNFVDSNIKVIINTSLLSLLRISILNVLGHWLVNSRK